MIDFNEISAISKTWNYRKTEDRNGTEYSFTIPEYSEKLKLKKIGGKSVVWNQSQKRTYSTTACSYEISDGVIRVYDITSSDNRFIFTPYSNRLVVNHIYYQTAIVKSDGEHNAGWQNYQGIDVTTKTNNSEFTTIEKIGTATTSSCYIQMMGTMNFEYFIRENSVALIDLTKLFGAGNEPTSTTDPRITAIKKYLETHPEYNEGEIIDSLVDEIEVDGVNLFDVPQMFVDVHPETAVKKTDDTLEVLSIPQRLFTTKIPINIPSGSIVKVIGLVGGVINCRVNFYRNNSLVTRVKSTDNDGVVKTDVKTLTNNVDSMCLDWSDKGNEYCKFKIMISRVNTDYKPYTAPKILTTNFPSLKSAGSVYDYIDFTSAVKLPNGNYTVNVVRNVGSVDLGTLRWTSETSYTTGQFRVEANHLISGGVIPKYNGNLLNIYFDTVAPKGYSQFNDGELGWSNASSSIVLRARKIYLTDLSAQEFKQAMEGQILYYELATPTIETITISAELLEWLKVEYGGNMYYNQDGLSLPIPNTTSIHKHVEKTEELAQIVIDDEIVWSAPVSMFNLYDDDIIIDDDETSVNEDEVIDNE